MEADTALPNTGKAGIDGCVAAIDYTQVRERAASELQPRKVLLRQANHETATLSGWLLHYLCMPFANPNRRAGGQFVLLCGSAVLASTALLAAQEAEQPQIPPTVIVRQAVAREVAAANGPQPKYMFRSRRQTPKGSQTKLYVETNEAMAGMLVAVNDQPISIQQQQAEKDHLAWLANNPDQLRKKRAREKEDADRTLRIVKALPDAFRYEYAGLEKGDSAPGKAGDQLVRLKFSPNPSYNPPSRVEQVLEGMQGYLVIDTTQQRLALIDGTLFRDVSFGWGLIGHLDKGGHFLVQQADVGDGCWEITLMSLKITGRILMFKSISMISNETFSDFQRVPDDTTFAKAVDLLKSQQEKLAHNHEPETSGSTKPPQQ